MLFPHASDFSKYHREMLLSPSCQNQKKTTTLQKTIKKLEIEHTGAEQFCFMGEIRE